jgi:Peptidase family M23
VQTMTARRVRIRVLFALLLALVTAGLVTVRATPAFAAPSDVQMPFPCGETWYASTYSGHSPSEYSIDWNLSGQEDHNKPVLAGAAGTATVQSYQNPGYGNYVDVNIGGGWVLRYAHLETVSVTTGQQVTAQTQIGTVGASGLSGSPPPYHLHYEQRLNGTVQAATFNGSAISYAYSLPGNPYNSANCGSSAGVREAFLDSRGVYFRTGDYSGWTLMADSTSHPLDVAVSGSRMGIINDGGASYRVNDSSSWTQIVSSSLHPTAIAVNDSARMAFIDDQGAYFRTSDTSGWTQLSASTAHPIAVAVSGSRMGIINDGGAYYRVNDSSSWVQIEDTTNHPRAIAVSDSGRMAFIDDRGAYFRTSDNSGWTLLTDSSDSPVSMAVSGNRMGIINSSGAAYRIDDNSSWLTVDGSSNSPTKIAVAG